MNTIHSFSELAKAFKVRDASEKKPQKEWASSQQKKFLTCPVCGGKMTYIAGTNIVYCENPLEKDNKPVIDEKTGKQKICHFRKLLDEKGIGYAEYIFR